MFFSRQFPIFPFFSPPCGVGGKNASNNDLHLLTQTMLLAVAVPLLTICPPAVDLKVHLDCAQQMLGSAFP